MSEQGMAAPDEVAIARAKGFDEGWREARQIQPDPGLILLLGAVIGALIAWLVKA